MSGKAKPWKAWRAWRLEGDGSLWPMFDAALQRRWLRGPNFALCRTDEHPAPQEDCYCGLHVVERLDDLLDYLPAFHDLDLPWIVGRVECRGTRLPASYPTDPPGTWRVAQVRLVGPLLVPRRQRPMVPLLNRCWNLPVKLDGDLLPGDERSASVRSRP